MAIKINPDLCPQNHRCPLIKMCPKEAISQVGNQLPQISEEKCIECGKCIKSCGMHAISFYH